MQQHLQSTVKSLASETEQNANERSMFMHNEQRWQDA